MNPNTYDPTTHKVVAVNSVVLNPASGVVWEFLQTYSETPSFNKAFRLAQEIRKQLPAPRIAEPGWGVIVEAGVREHDERLRWVHIDSGVGERWSCADFREYDRHWDDLIDPKVVQR